MIQAVVFDLDDTLFPEHQFVMSGFHAVGQHVKVWFGVDGFFEQAECLFSAGNRGTIFNRALEQLGIDPKPSVITTLLSVYREHRPQIELYEDARWAMAFFGQSWKTGIITDGFLVTQRNKVRALGIESRFGIVLYTDEYGREGWKPSPISYQKVMEALSCSGPECVYIADNPVKDFVAARKLGWKTIQLRRKGGEYSNLVAQVGYEADFTVESLYDLRELI